MITAALKEKFKAHFGDCTGAGVFAAPGRINLIGEHTDYNGGFVMPGAIDKAIFAVVKPNGTRTVRLYAADPDETASFDPDTHKLPDRQWARYVYGICREMKRRGATVGGFDAAFCGNVPLGAGLSSSAALESCFAVAINDLFNNGEAVGKMELARAGQDTEHNYCGVKCGIMDQFASVFGRADSLMLLDCRSMEHRYLPFSPAGMKLMLVDSVVKHTLVDSPYNRRRESCERVSARLGVETLRDADMLMLEKVRSDISDEDFRRARYVIGEKERVLAVCEALEKGDYAMVGSMMYQTHRGLAEDYEVSCPEIDFLVDVARAEGVTGSRIMGGGFGGCTINLVEADKAEAFAESVRGGFADRYGHEPRIYDVIISDGARRLE